MEKKSLNEMPNTGMPSRESVLMDSLTEKTMPDDEKGEDAAKRFHEKALYAEQERPNLCEYLYPAVTGKTNRANQADNEKGGVGFSRPST